MGVRCGKCKSGNVLTSYVPGIGAVGESCIMCGNYVGSQYGFYNESPLKVKKAPAKERVEEMAVPETPAKKIGRCSNCKRDKKRLYTHDLCGGCHNEYYKAPKGEREKALATARKKFMEKEAGGPPGGVDIVFLDMVGPAGPAPTEKKKKRILSPLKRHDQASTETDKDTQELRIKYSEERDGNTIAAIRAEADKQRRGISGQVLLMLEYAIEQKMWTTK
jgi:hypothetical protein